MADTRVPEALCFRVAPTDVTAVVSQVIASSHADLDIHRILVLMCHKDMKHKGKEVWANIRLASPIVNAAYAWGAGLAPNEEGMDRAIDFVLTVSADVWKVAPETAKIALIDHELCHAVYNPENDKPGIITHDCEEFIAVVRRYGAWKADLAAMMAAFNKDKENTDGGNAK